MEHEGNTYFSTNGADPSKWALKYCIVNDTNRFPWASSSGKGVIYYMKDEWNNECPYDFKGILFTINNESKYTFDAGGNSASDASLAGFTNNVYSNVISTYITGNKPHLNAIVFEGTNCHSNVFGPNCHSNVIGANCNCNTFEQECNNIVFDAKCRYIKVGSGNEYIHLNPTGQLG